MNDQDFKMDLNIIAAETDLSKYINPRSNVALKIIKTAYLKH